MDKRKDDWIIRHKASRTNSGWVSGLHSEYRKIFHSFNYLLGILRYVASIACLSAMLLYLGFTTEAIDRALIMRIIRISQFLFLFKVIFEYGLDFRRTWHTGNLITKRVFHNDC